MSKAKLEGAKLGWQLREITYPIVTPWMIIRQDHIDVDGEGATTYTYFESNGAVVVVPVTEDGRMVLIRQYRYAVDDWCLEVPAGGLHDRKGADPADVTRDELHEEAGATCKTLLHMHNVYSNNSISDEVMHVYLALGVELSGATAHESTEHIEVVVMPAVEAVEMARDGRMKDALSALAILICEPKLRELGLLA